MSVALELNGAEPSAVQLAAATGSYGHFTAMQVRDGRVRGLAHHLTRLVTSTELLFGSDLDVDLVRGHVRRLVAGRGALSVRVLVFSRSSEEDPVMAPEVLVRTGPPREHVADPIRLRSVRYERDLPEVKHTGTFGLIHHSRQAVLAGYEDALFVDHSGHISEASIWNVGFLEGDTVVWPDAAVLPGITYLVLRDRLAAAGVAQVTRKVHPRELPGFDAVFLTNSETVGRPVASVDDVVLRNDPAAARLLADAYETAPWDEI
ncbi:aminotransferase class IV [Amycolatopsis sp. FDAARGOS 1241]|uniref:aminotransferase class IV n=1 Tax=Amycolatopsis sp. FDAARGOS 1241 TaxID=2778070 RepID=UPI0019505E2B|nr:aminotransferase class IV [Amycolatopsis sp. FDAARGOS 1241]QRP49222.1 aminotransferase class IV [Amycolatopsis sp. FDAARGOS 1241]